LYKSKSLADYVIEHFKDEKSGLFFYTSDLDESLITRKMELSDNVIPASNSSFAKSLFKLGKYFYNEEYQKSKDTYSKGMEVAENIRMWPSYAYMYEISKARAMVRNNEKHIELGLLSGYVAKNKLKLINGRMRRYIGEILLTIDDQHMSDAEGWIQKAIAADERNGVMFELGMDFALYAELFRRKEDRSKAKENQAKAINIFKECGADGWVEKYEKKMSAL
jgi:uncharacterized protein YyaL (SSP411 family)